MKLYLICLWMDIQIAWVTFKNSRADWKTFKLNRELLILQAKNKIN